MDVLRLIYSICDKFKITELRHHQKTAINALSDGKDVFVGTKTGSGKSLAYECFPLIRQGSSVLVIAPLVSIMAEQCNRLMQYGFSATYIGRDPIDHDGIINGEYDFVFGSPECFLDNTKWRTMLKSDIYQQKLRLIVVDEAHTVIQWGEGSKKEDPFRIAFSRIGELRSLCPKAQLLAPTATSGPTQRRQIMKTLCFKPIHDVITESPDRPNIKISSICIPNNDDPEDTFKFLINELSTVKEELPRHVIFCESIINVSKVHSVFVKHFGQSCKLFDMYHSKTNEKVKSKIRKDMSEEGNIRVLICTNSAGMGVNYHGLNNVIHYGLPREMDTFVQQMGRAGRDGNFAHELVLFKAHKGHLNRVESDLVKLVKDSRQCRHEQLCSSYITKHTPIEPKHKCCDVCEKSCACGEDTCPESHKVSTYSEENPESQDENEMKREVSDDDRKHLRHELFVLKYSLDDYSTVLNTELIHGLTEKVIDDIVLKCDILFTTADILNYLDIWTYDVALDIYNILCKVFGDIEMYTCTLGSDVESDRDSDISDC